MGFSSSAGTNECLVILVAIRHPIRASDLTIVGRQLSTIRLVKYLLRSSHLSRHYSKGHRTRKGYEIYRASSICAISQCFPIHAFRPDFPRQTRDYCTNGNYQCPLRRRRGVVSAVCLCPQQFDRVSDWVWVELSTCSLKDIGALGHYPPVSDPCCPEERGRTYTKSLFWRHGIVLLSASAARTACGVLFYQHEA